MKRGILLAAAVLLVTGAASAHLLTTTSQATTAKLAAPEKPLPAKVLLSDRLTRPVSQPSPAPVVRNASVDIRQAPVPMQARFRTPVALPRDDIGTADAKTDAKTDVGLSADSATGDKSNMAAARAAIAADGYKDVQILRGDNGVWHAKALRGKTAVLLMVDSKGTVSTAD